jgi:hypothetical protein
MKISNKIMECLGYPSGQCEIVALCFSAAVTGMQQETHGYVHAYYAELLLYLT